MPGSLLIVDDEPEIVELLSEMVRHLAGTVRTAANGRDAMKIIKAGEIDAIVSDINMPVMNGFLLLLEVRRMSSLLPFVIVTAFDDKENMLEAIRLNANGFLEKPFDEAQVIQSVKEALDFGVKLREFEAGLEEEFNCLNKPADRIAKRKEMMRALFSVRYGTSTSKI